ncbi:TIR-like protein FxsC [Dactylosporangium sp. CS-033363]|uniref:TIR-like protein FxsC n=1 Tax=Dactylosporangium sp. CS-033363 TaxID=3239935 RepID=UPI003D89C2EB
MEQAPYFFISYATDGGGLDDDLVRRFFADLSEEVRVRTGLSSRAGVGFLDADTLRVGATWTTELFTALSTSRTFLALVSPRYVHSEWCGREWSLFAERTARHQPETPAPGAALIPVLWTPPRDLPPVVAERQLFTDEFSESYRRGGMRQLMRLQRNRDEYVAFVSALAEHIIEVATADPVPAAAVRDWETVRSAFVPGTRVSTPRDAQAVVEAVFAAAGRSPDSAWICRGPRTTARDLRGLRERMPPDRPCYLVYEGDLTPDAEHQLDLLRVGGRPVVTVPVRALRAALADGREATYLNELERTYGSRDNLFDTKNALTDERFLFGRDALLNTIGSALKRDEHVLVTGLRKVGKTSLLNVLRQHLVDQPVCTVDLQRFDRHHDDWPVELFHLMLKSFDRWGAAERGHWPFTPARPGTVTELEAELERRIEHLGTPVRMTVILDELERVFPGPGETHAARQWIRAAGALRVLAQGDRRHVALVGADLRPVVTRENLLGPAGTNPWFSFLQERPLPLLDRTALDDMVHSLAGEMGVDSVDGAFTDELFQLSGGHPSLARTLAGEAYRRRAVATRLSGRDLRLALDRLDDNDEVGYFLRNNLWQLTTGAEQRVLLALARVTAGAPPGRAAERGAAEAALHAQGMLDGDRIRIGLLDRWLRDGAA